MSSRDRSLQDKLKVLFKKGPSAPLPARNELVVSGEVERELSADTPLHRRLRALKELGEKAIHVRVQEGGVEKLWSLTRDLLEESNVEARHAALWFLRCLAEGQADYLQIMRTILFHYLRDTHARHPPEDSQLRFKLLHTLTNTGKNINCFEEEIGPFLLEWLPQIQPPTQLVEFLQLIINVVKFNATYLDEEIVHGIVNNACHLCVYSAEAAVVQCGLSLLEAVVSYSLLPRAALRTFVAALCRTVNLEHYCQTSWKLMRNVVGADMGHAALQQLVELLRAGSEEGGLLRGAVFYINMALWGPRRVPTLRVSFLAVLPAFLKALEGNQPVVTYEVVLSVQSVVSRVPLELCEPAWDVLLSILRAVLQQDKSYEPPNELIHNQVHAVITSIEQLQDAGQYCGDADALLELIDCCGHERPEASTMRLVSARAAALAPWGAEGAGAAAALAERYLRHEPRRAVRLHTLHAILAFIKRNRYLYGEELTELVGLPVLGACALDADVALRAAAARALAELAQASASDACTDLIDLLEKILNRPFEMYVSDVAIPAEADVSDLCGAAAGLLALLQHKLHAAPAAHAARCFLVLLDHLDAHYRRHTLFMHHPDIRIKIFEMLFGLRANQFNCVGFCYDASGAAVHGAAALRLKPVCSPFLMAEPPAQRGHQHQPLQPKDLPPLKVELIRRRSSWQGVSLLPVGRAARLLAAALAREKDWAVLARVLRALPLLLQARALALGRRAQDIDMLASTLCSMISDRSLNFPECLRVPSGQKLLVSEFHSTALPGLASLAPYHSYLEPQTQQRIVRCLLKYGMVLRTPQPYINALTIFTLETRETMVKMLPEVLLDLSKISDTKAIASPMLEFLSTLTRLPKVFASFVEDQYMSVFAILLPYTNPSRYNHYVVSLAHHVIAAWFLKCRLSYRRNFVRFIIHGLHNYIIMPFEEQLQYKTNHFPNANEDSSNRQRSSSLGSKAVSRAPLGGRAGGASASAAFHVELTETCLDLLARYTSTPCSVKPHRSDTAEFLFSGGQSMTWLVGHKLITITTSGCLQNSIKQGLCDRCAVLCRQHADSVASPLPPLQPACCDQPAGDNAQVPAKECGAEAEAGGGNQLQPPAPHNPPEVKRQNSSENNKTNDPLVAVLNQFSQHFEKISKEVCGAQDTDEAAWSRVGELAAAGLCPCWCANWAEVHVRSPTGDVCWVMRMQNQMNWDYLLESPLQELAALLSPAGAGGAAGEARGAGEAAGRTGAAAGRTGEAAGRVGEDSAPRSRSGSSSSQSRPQSSLPQDLHKSSSDSIVGNDKKTQQASQSIMSQPQNSSAAGSSTSRMSTQPINIPGSPQRQSSSSTTDDDDMLLIVPEGKSRHPVRRSNSSPEMSSSWKAAALQASTPAAPAAPAPDLTLHPDDMILLPSCEPTGSTSLSMHATKKAAKKSDMRVSCEAIPEEMCGTSPHAAHHHLMTYNSDPGTGDAPHAPAAALNHHHQLQKLLLNRRRAGSVACVCVQTASDGTVPEGRRDDLPPLARSKRSNTISVMSPTRRHRQVSRHPECARYNICPYVNTISVMSPTRRHRQVSRHPECARYNICPYVNTISVMSPTRRHRQVSRHPECARYNICPYVNTISVMSPTRRHRQVSRHPECARYNICPYVNTISVMSPTRRHRQVSRHPECARYNICPYVNTISVMSPTRRHRQVSRHPECARYNICPYVNTISVMSPTRRHRQVSRHPECARYNICPYVNTISVMSPTRRHRQVSRHPECARYNICPYVNTISVMSPTRRHRQVSRHPECARYNICPYVNTISVMSPTRRHRQVSRHPECARYNICPYVNTISVMSPTRRHRQVSRHPECARYNICPYVNTISVMSPTRRHRQVSRHPECARYNICPYVNTISVMSPTRRHRQVSRHPECARYNICPYVNTISVMSPTRRHRQVSRHPECARYNICPYVNTISVMSPTRRHRQVSRHPECARYNICPYVNTISVMSPTRRHRQVSRHPECARYNICPYVNTISVMSPTRRHRQVSRHPECARYNICPYVNTISVMSPTRRHRQVSRHPECARYNICPYVNTISVMSPTRRHRQVSRHPECARYNICPYVNTISVMSPTRRHRQVSRHPECARYNICPYVNTISVMSPTRRHRQVSRHPECARYNICPYVNTISVMSPTRRHRQVSRHPECARYNICPYVNTISVMSPTRRHRQVSRHPECARYNICPYVNTISVMSPTRRHRQVSRHPECARYNICPYVNTISVMSPTRRHRQVSRHPECARYNICPYVNTISVMSPTRRHRQVSRHPECARYNICPYVNTISVMSPTRRHRQVSRHPECARYNICPYVNTISVMSPTRRHRQVSRHPECARYNICPYVNTISVMSPTRRHRQVSRHPECARYNICPYVNTISVMSPTRRHRQVSRHPECARYNICPYVNTISVMSPTRRHRQVSRHPECARYNICPYVNTISVMSPTRRHRQVSRHPECARYNICPYVNTISVMSPTRRHRQVSRHPECARYNICPYVNTISVMSPTRRHRQVSRHPECARHNICPYVNTISVMSPTRRHRQVSRHPECARYNICPYVNTISVMSPTRRHRQVSRHPECARYNICPYVNTISVMSPTRRHRQVSRHPECARYNICPYVNTISVMSPTRRHRQVSRHPECARYNICPYVNTISVMSPTRRHSVSAGRAGGGAGGAVGAGGGGVTPSFVFLQLYHNMSTYPITPPVPGETPTILNPLAERPLRVSGVQHERTIKNLDLVPPVETYKIGVLYVGPGQQDNEVLILKNEYGSVRYAEFLTQLGTLVSLEGGDDDQPHLFLNLEKGGKDGHYTYVWNDDIMQVLFHVATAMPSSAKDPTCNEKRKYIGNDYVSIVYNDSGADFNIHTIKGQLNFCIVVVEPYEHGMNRVFIKTKDERIRTKFLAHLDTHCVSDANVALLARQMALHCALASHISQSLKLGGAPYASNSLERLRIIKRLRVRAQAERLAAAARAPEPYAGPPDLAHRVAIDDFNDYT
ncbi:tuberin isoform X4 [Helicoverpa zea]|uniref:tuberin isoform X4 n=1 Tax=Helicoverpa zea TaxID=7113 RepID=UPI001F57BC7B|nr:tuberin isoform X4 [Helicoverpa zea]